ncbi:MAG: TrkH family potassium uptake protein [Candidatus Cloacimonetes bacterium]|nr:TrkH family potassium uptake protein [Candidatus Cloacimonadota bacterium]
MKKCVSIFDNIFVVIASINLFLILFTQSGKADHVWQINYFYTYTTVILLLLRSSIVFIQNSFSGYTLRRLSIDILFVFFSFFTIKYSLKLIQFYFVIRALALLLKKYSKSKKDIHTYNNLFKYPALWVILSFLSTIFIGTLILLLPGITNKEVNINFIDALFTSTSSVCITGLTVYDIGVSFSHIGQLLILILIQVGGLGIMTISSALAIAIGQRFSLRSGALIQNVLNRNYSIDFPQLLKNIITFTFTVEILGALLLIYPFYKYFGNIAQSVYYAIFHSISAFCNAGFSLFSGNLLAFRTNPIVTFTITTLVIIGGLGFAVIDDSKKIFRHNGRFKQLKLHSKIVLVTSLALILSGTLLFFISEYNYTMKSFGFFEKLQSSYFQSVTTRSAGFNTIDFSQISFATVLLTVFLMYVGSSPGSTGGGIKTTTLAIIVLSIISILKGNKDLVVFNRHISETTLLKAMAIIALSLFFILSILFMLTLIEPFSFEKIFFEAFSAFSTTGLTMGITSMFSSVGKLLIIILMFIGRVGPLTFIFLLSEHVTPMKYVVPQENVEIG